MKCLFLIAAMLSAWGMTDCNAAEPSIMVKMHFAISWREICQLEKYLKDNVAKQIVTGKTGGTLDTGKLVLCNFPDHCPKGSADKAVVNMYVSKISGNKDVSNIDVAMTQKLYKVLHYFYEEKQERYLGNLFVGKITDVTVAGKDAPAKSTAYTEIERLYIGIGVACIILILIVVILVSIACFKNRNKPKEDRYTSKATYQKDDQTVRTYPPSSAENKGYDGQHDSRESTRF